MSSIIIGLLIDSKPSFGEIPHKNAAQKNGIKHKITFFNAHLVLVGQSAISVVVRKPHVFYSTISFKVKWR